MAKPEDKTQLGQLTPAVKEAIEKQRAAAARPSSQSAEADEKTMIAESRSLPGKPAQVSPSAKTDFVPGSVAVGPPPAAPGGNYPASAPKLSSQATLMLDRASFTADAPQTGVVVPTLMRDRPLDQVPVVETPPPKTPWGRWLLGPMIAIAIAAGTVAVARRFMPLDNKQKARPQGQIRVQTDPAGAQVFVNGVPFPHFTPTVVDGTVGATLHVVFKLDGYEAKSADVFVSEGDHPFNAKLEALPAPPTPEPPPPTPEPPPPKREHRPARPVRVKPIAQQPAAIEEPVEPVSEEPAGVAKLSVFVRPWAIVFVDGTRLRQTPIDSFQVRSGKHVVELVNDGKSKREKILLNMRPGEVEEIRRNWDAP